MIPEQLPNSAEGTAIPIHYFGTLAILETARWALHNHREQVAEYLNLNDGMVQEIQDVIEKILSGGGE